MKESHGLKYLQYLKIGIDELQWLQYEEHERRMRRMLARFMSHGLVTGRTRRNSLGRAWKVHDDDDDGTISIYSSMGRVVGGSYGSQEHAWAVDKDGVPIQMDNDQIVATLPNDATWYTVVMRRALTDYDRGSLSVTVGSAVVNGTGTEFTRLSGVTTDGYGRGSLIRIDAADTAHGHDGTYEVDQVINDGQVILTAPVGGSANETGIPFTLAGDFSTAPPADPDRSQRWVPEFQVVARVRDPSNSDLILFDVKRDDAFAPKVTLIDRRAANLFREQPQGMASRGLALQPEIVGAAAAPFGDAQMQIASIYTGLPAGAHARNVALAREQNDGMLALVEIPSTTTIHVREFDNFEDLWQDPAGGGAVVLSAAGTYPAIEQLPPECGNTHIAFYENTGDNKVYRSTTANNGQAFAAAVATWDPTAINPNDRVQDLVAYMGRNHRLFLFGSYYVWNAVPANTYKQIRYIYSDDYGTTWNTNANAGFNAVTGTAGTDDTEPTVTQGPDGLIHLAYVRDNGVSVEIRGKVSDDETGIVWTLGVPYSTFVWTLGGRTGWDNHGPAIYVSPDNVVAVVFNEEDGANAQRVRVATVGDDDSAFGAVSCITNREVFRVSTANGTSLSLKSKLRQLRDGSIMLAMAHDNGGTPDVSVSYLLRPMTTGYIDTAVQEIG